MDCEEGFWRGRPAAEMSLRIKAVVENFVRELKAALEADIQDRIMKEREMNSYLEEREREVAEREAAWKAELTRREVWHFLNPESAICILHSTVLLSKFLITVANILSFTSLQSSTLWTLMSE